MSSVHVVALLMQEYAENKPVSDLIETICKNDSNLFFCMCSVGGEMRYWFDIRETDGMTTLGSEPSPEKAVEALIRYGYQSL